MQGGVGGCPAIRDPIPDLLVSVIENAYPTISKRLGDMLDIFTILTGEGEADVIIEFVLLF